MWVGCAWLIQATVLRFLSAVSLLVGPQIVVDGDDHGKVREKMPVRFLLTIRATFIVLIWPRIELSLEAKKDIVAH